MERSTTLLLSLCMPMLTCSCGSSSQAPAAGATGAGGATMSTSTASSGAAGAGGAGGFVHASKGAIVDGSGRPLALRCVNLGSWLNPEPNMIGADPAGFLMGPTELRTRLEGLVGQAAADAFWQSWESTFVTEADFEQIASFGFNCVRLPLNAKRIGAPGTPPVSLVETALAPVDHAVQWGSAHGVYVVLDMHAALGGQNDVSTVGDVPRSDTTPQLWTGPSAAANQAYMVDLWRALAARYATSTAVGGLDLLNEPSLPAGVSGSVLTEYYARTIAAIRTVDDHHLLFLEGDSFAYDFSMFSAPLDPNQAYELHEYALGQPAWTTPNAAALEPFLALSQAQAVPLWLGEFGDNTLSWIQSMLTLVEPHDIGWALWSWKQRPFAASDPVLESVTLPSSWAPVFSYLVSASPKSPPASPGQALQDLLAAVALAQCTESASFAQALMSP